MAVADVEIRGMREERVRLHAEHSGIVQKAATEKRGFLAEETERMGKIETKMGELKGVIDAEERSRAYDKELAEKPEPTAKPGEEQRGADVGGKAAREFRSSFISYLRRGGDGAYAACTEARGRYMESLPVEERGLTAASPTQAGYLFAPTQFSSELIKAADNELPLRAKIRKFPVPAGMSLGNPKRTARLGRMTKGTEVSTAPENTALTFGKKELKPSPFSDMVKLSRQLMLAAPNVDQILRDEIAYAYAQTQEYEILNGNGVGGPLGVFTASADGISTARDMATDNTSTAMTYKGLTNAKFSLRSAYRKNAEWLFHRDGIKQIMGILDGQNRPIFLASAIVGEPDRVLNMPVIESEDAPNTFTTGLYVGLLGNWNYYWLAESQEIEIRVAYELYMATKQIGYFYQMDMDGQAVIDEAFTRVKLG